MWQAMIDRPLLDVTSYGRRGPSSQAKLSPAEIDHIRRTVSRTPEVMVKVLTRGGQDLRAVPRHMSYLDRGGELAFETDDGLLRSGGDETSELLEDWDLDLEDVRRSADLSAGQGRQLPKLVHKLLFSMPPGTPPQKVLGAARNFAREEFALQHRYAFVLHTDEPHPHVHMVVKAVSEQGIRLNIKKATLRHWRSEFARHLRELGVPANATERAVRGQNQKSKKDGIYRASRRGESTFMRRRAEQVVAELRSRRIIEEPSKRVLETRRHVKSGWDAVTRILGREGHADLARISEEYQQRLKPPLTDRELTAAAIVEEFKRQRSWEDRA